MVNIIHSLFFLEAHIVVKHLLIDFLIDGFVLIDYFFQFLSQELDFSLQDLYFYAIGAKLNWVFCCCIIVRRLFSKLRVLFIVAFVVLVILRLNPSRDFLEIPTFQSRFSEFRSWLKLGLRDFLNHYVRLSLDVVVLWYVRRRNNSKISTPTHPRLIHLFRRQASQNLLNASNNLVKDWRLIACFASDEHISNTLSDEFKGLREILVKK